MIALEIVGQYADSTDLLGQCTQLEHPKAPR
jgi:hypothetical protein